MEVRWGADPDTLDVPIIVEHRGVGGDGGVREEEEEEEEAKRSVEVGISVVSNADASTETEPFVEEEKEEEELTCDQQGDGGPGEVEGGEGAEGLREDPVADAEQKVEAVVVAATTSPRRGASVYLESEMPEGAGGRGEVRPPPMSDAAKEQVERILRELAWAEQALEARKRWLRESKRAQRDHHDLNERLRHPGAGVVPRLDFQQ